MKRILSWRRFELLEQKRLKAADLAECPDALGPAVVEAADAMPSCEAIEAQTQTGNLEIPMSLSESSDAEESSDDADGGVSDDSDENESDDSDDGDESNDDESDVDDSDEGDDDSSDDDSGDDDSDDDDSDDDDSDDDDSDDDDDMDDEDDSDEGDDDPSDENDTDGDNDDEDDLANPPTSAPILSNVSGGNSGLTAPTPGVSAARAASRSIASAAPAASLSVATTVDPNLLDAVYVRPENRHETDEQSPLLKDDAIGHRESTDAAFASIANNPFTWTA